MLFGHYPYSLVYFAQRPVLNVENVKIKFSEHFSSAATLGRNIQILNLSTVLNVANLLRMKQDSKLIPDSLIVKQRRAS